MWQTLARCSGYLLVECWLRRCKFECNMALIYYVTMFTVSTCTLVNLLLQITHFTEKFFAALVEAAFKHHTKVMSHSGIAVASAHTAGHKTSFAHKRYNAKWFIFFRQISQGSNLAYAFTLCLYLILNISHPQSIDENSHSCEWLWLHCTRY